MTQSVLKACLVGATGRMGTELRTAARQRSDLIFERGLAENRSDPSDQFDGLPVTNDPEKAVQGVDVVIDFSAPEATLETLQVAADESIPFVTGTTGFDDSERQRLDDFAQSIPLLKAANFSIGINVLKKLTRLTSDALSDDFDIEIFEAHHRNKTDAPSGTAKQLGRAASDGQQSQLKETAVWTRHGDTGDRSDKEIGFQVLRGGDIKGEHTVYFCGAGERIELTHRAGTRQIFADGAIDAAVWLTDRPPGLYGMDDLLF